LSDTEPVEKITQFKSFKLQIISVLLLERRYSKSGLYLRKLVLFELALGTHLRNLYKRLKKEREGRSECLMLEFEKNKNEMYLYFCSDLVLSPV